MRQLHRSLLTLCCLVHLAIAGYTSTSVATTQHTQLLTTLACESPDHCRNRLGTFTTTRIQPLAGARIHFAAGNGDKNCPSASRDHSTLARSPATDKKRISKFPSLGLRGPKRGGGTHGPSLDALGVVRMHGSGQILARTAPGPVRPPWRALLAARTEHPRRPPTGCSRATRHSYWNLGRPQAIKLWAHSPRSPLHKGRKSTGIATRSHDRYQRDRKSMKIVGCTMPATGRRRDRHSLPPLAEVINAIKGRSALCHFPARPRKLAETLGGKLNRTKSNAGSE